MTEMTSPQTAHSAEYDTVQYDQLDSEPLSVTIVTAVATFCNEEVTELEPLHYTVNTDALERLFEPRANGVRSEGALIFEYNDCLITVRADGEIRIESA
ncbi:hypothetical protein SAMN04487967_1518 [Natronorubrum sediminis]|uniref:Halobacterial output domain-containing protein n=1 Tax=Natronorubrum sediminis TaxID=640943 RepID=A0A1H6FTY4_9EURY|nr:HalOD1 output domain-containing protein [Natronorubrum sediminis]SEH14257.1 hypothetical protein SAMN04487967_1518 [Natronorubrum sediminis]